MQINYLFVLISFLLGIAIINYLRSFDLHEKEPFLKMLLVTLWGGIWSIAISIFLYDMVGKTGITGIENVFGAVFVIGPVEEIAKFMALLLSYGFIKNEINEPTDGLIYMSCVALGFSLIENYFYATRAPDAGYLIILRVFFSTPAHILSSLFMGLAFYVIVKHKKGVQLFLAAFGFAVLIHGLYDGIVFHGLTTLFLISILYIGYIWALNLLSYTTAKSPFRPSLKQFVEQYKNPVTEKGLKCLNCGDSDPKPTYKAGKIRFQQCDACGRFVATDQDLFRIFRHFGSEFRNLNRYYRHKDIAKTQYSTVHKGNSVSEKKRLAFFELDELNEALDDINQNVVRQIEEKWWFTKGMQIA
jgi:RsiW-degrading membrane proteinase PrsW (M82 family)